MRGHRITHPEENGGAWRAGDDTRRLPLVGLLVMLRNRRAAQRGHTLALRGA
jgi:hypothetical protein